MTPESPDLTRAAAGAAPPSGTASAPSGSPTAAPGTAGAGAGTAASGRGDGRPSGPTGLSTPLWRAIAVFRAASVGYAVFLMVQYLDLLARPWAAWGVLCAMAAWTAASAVLYARPHRRTRLLLAADLTVAFGCLAATALAVEPGYLRMAPPLTTTWFGGAVLAAAVLAGRRVALGAALAHGVVDIAVRTAMGLTITAAVPRGVVLLLLAGYSVGYLATYAAAAERRFAEAVELEARTRERERLGRSIHDSVLQVLAMVQRRGAEAGGEAAELGRLAGEQEARLRALIAGRHGAGPADGPAGGADGGAAPSAAPGDAPPTADLAGLLDAHAGARVTLSAPATEVAVEARAAREIDAAVREALSNVERHCPPGTRAWVLLEDEGGTVTVTIRDEGPGIEPHRLDEAAAEGRLGLAQSIRGRIADLGGTAEITAAPGQGTEIELRVPR
ncbi:MacS family sensor histidine kinase [Streptomonospora arabica]|uniref:MacS family sensor histidine kinase n=1 Tax=Streptomonospora arabica TaxID=412417 RepID=A0ABV9SJN0_9ACTN